MLNNRLANIIVFVWIDEITGWPIFLMCSRLKMLNLTLVKYLVGQYYGGFFIEIIVGNIDVFLIHEITGG